MADAQTILAALYQVLEERRRHPRAGSYVAALLAGGVEAIGAKLHEECQEVIEAARGRAREPVVHEAADVLFHLLVLLVSRRVPLGAVGEELARRFGIGGLEEKAARSRSGRRRREGA